MESNNPFPVNPLGYLIGSYFACILYGLHLTQLYTYFTRYRYDGIRTKLLVCWVWGLSTFQIVIIVVSGWRYFVGGLHDNLKIWGEFWLPLSIQDALLYFGRRAWMLWDRRRWIRVVFTVLPTITLLCGFALAITARLWSDDPWESPAVFAARPIGVPSQVVAILWMGLSALTDGMITLLLVVRLARVRGSASSSPIRSAITRLIALTLETVLLTHVVGAAMCIIFLASPQATRTQEAIFWVLLEIITELYALSILFTINSRNAAKDSGGDGTSLDGGVRHNTDNGGHYNNNNSSDGEGTEARENLELRQTVLDRRVEGYQGNAPFGVFLPGLHYQLGSANRHSHTIHQTETDFTGVTEISSRGGGNGVTGATTGTGTGTETPSSHQQSIFTPALLVETDIQAWPGLVLPSSGSAARSTESLDDK